MKMKRIYFSFLDAFRGISYIWHREQNFRIQCICSTLVIGIAYILHVRKSEFIVLLLLVLLVLLLEIINSVIEQFIDIIKPRMDYHAGLLKDMMAAAVLCASVGAAIIGIVIFAPYIIPIFFV